MNTEWKGWFQIWENWNSCNQKHDVFLKIDWYLLISEHLQNTLISNSILKLQYFKCKMTVHGSRLTVLTSEVLWHKWITNFIWKAWFFKWKMMLTGFILLRFLYIKHNLVQMRLSMWVQWRVRGVLKQFLRIKITDAHLKMDFHLSTHTFHSLDFHFCFTGP